MSGPLDTAALETLLRKRLDWQRDSDGSIAAGRYRVSRWHSAGPTVYIAWRQTKNGWHKLGDYATADEAKAVCEREA